MRSAEEKATVGSSSPPPPDTDLGTGPPAWERFRIRSWLARLEQAEQEGRPVSGPPGERVRAAEGERPLPPPSDLESLVRDCLTVLYGPPVVDSVPGRLKGRPAAVEALRRQRERRAKGKRRGALERLARRFPHPVHPARWKVLGEEVGSELDRRQEERDARTPWYVRPDARREARVRAAFLALTDERVQGAGVEDLAAALRSALEAAFAGDLVGPDWSPRSETADARRRRREAEARLAASEAARLAVDPAREAELRMERRDRAARIEARAEELTAGQRAVYRLREGEGWTYEEIAEALGISRAAARNRMRRARDRLDESA